MDPKSKKASYKEIHLPLGVVGVCTEERPWPTLEKGTRATEVSISGRKKKISKDHKLNPQWGAVESGCLGPANLQLERCGLRGTHAVSTSPGTRRVSASSAARPAPSQTPRPIRPVLRGSATPRARGGTLSRVPVSALGLWESAEFKKPRRKASPG